MTPIRGSALKISNTVVRFASPGCKEWAEGLAREVAFVEGDWAALGWALGSVRVLFDYREAPLGSLVELPSVAEKFAQHASDNHTWLSSVTSFGWGLLFACQFFRATNGPLERIGCSLAALGCAVLGTVELIDWRSQRKVPPSNDVNAVIQFYKAELKRRFHSGLLSWIAISAATFLWVGVMLVGPERLAWWICCPCGLLWVGTMVLLLQGRRINRRRLERLEALLAERP
ncbi:MAG: hypothetical protein ACYCSP_13815 [Acidobacteriaceae bacterium]